MGFELRAVDVMLQYVGVFAAWMSLSMHWYWTATAWAIMAFYQQAGIQVEPLAMPLQIMMAAICLISLWACRYLYKHRKLFRPGMGSGLALKHQLLANSDGFRYGTAGPDPQSRWRSNHFPSDLRSSSSQRANRRSSSACASRCAS